METDKTTLEDLSLFNSEEAYAVFNRLNLTRTLNGRERMRANFSEALTGIEAIRGVQQTLQYILHHESHWPLQISNGSIMVIEKFYDALVDHIPEHPGSFSAFQYKLFHGPDFSLVKYSAGHFFDFIKGMQQLVNHFLANDTPPPLKKILTAAQQILNKEQFAVVTQNRTSADLSDPQLLQLASFARYHYKINTFDLLDIYARLDAWYGMAQAVKQFGLVFPEFLDNDRPVVSAHGLYHLLLEKPVSYDISLNPDENFLFLTGANMAGKSTFIKSVGIAVFLAHTGMGVPAKKMKLSLFDGLVSNINVVDNLVRGESYFYNEVQRIKATVSKINNGKKWLILIDELFKGTNVQDAMKCSGTVIEGFLKIRNSLFILSTHLYEIGNELQGHPNISFKYFETAVSDEQLHFSYQLKDGISNDRLGYLILKKEGVVEMLEKL